MSLFTAVQTFLMLMSLAGSFLNARKLRICFVLWLVCNIGWTAIDVYLAMYPRVAQDLVQMVFTVYGWICWSRKETE